MKHSDTIAITVITLIILAYLAPMLLGWLGIFWDDYNDSFPGIYFNARSVKQGVLPLWDPTTFAGGRLNFIPYTDIWYWPLYPFYFISNLNNPDIAFFWLIKLPRLFHWLICALSAYGLARSGIKILPVGAVTFALIYSFGTPLSNLVCEATKGYAAVWIPLAIWGILSFSRNRAFLMGLLGALAVAFMLSVNDAMDAVFSLVTVVGFLAFFFFTSVGKGPRLKKAGKIIIFGAMIITIGFLLAGFYWANMPESIAVHRDSPIGNVADWQVKESSMPWRYLLTLFVPNLYGTMTGSNLQNLVFKIVPIDAVFHFDGNLTGGYWVLLLITVGSVIGWKQRGVSQEITYLKRWWLVGAGLFIFSLMLVTGYFSPFYRVISRVIPIFGLPYPVRWRIMENLGIALLAGVSAHWLWKSRGRLSRQALGGFLLLVAALFLWGWALFFDFNKIGEGLKNNDWMLWLSRTPFIYMMLAVVGTIVLITASKKRWPRAVLIGAAAMEVVVTGFYASYFLSNYRETTEWYRRYSSPTDSAYYRWTNDSALTNLPAAGTGAFRTTFYSSRLDQMASLHGGDYLMGTCCKPMEPRLTAALDEITEGWPYDLTLLDPGSPFLRNMSVRYVALDSKKRITGIETEPRSLPGTKGIWLQRLTDPLPRVFTQDRVVLSSLEEARDELINRDLRQGAFLEGGKRLAVNSKRWTEGKGAIMSYQEFSDANGEQESVDHFNKLQELNKISRVWFPTPNRMNIEIEVQKPALLIATDVYHPGWKVTVDGLEQESLRVNYLQRGVWLDEGKHTVKWIFRPSAVKWSLFSVALGLLGLILLAYLRKGRQGDLTDK